MLSLCICPLPIKTKNHSIQQLHIHRQTAMQPPSHPEAALGRLCPQHTWVFCLLQKPKLPRISLLGLFKHFSKLENKFLYFNCSDNLEGISYWIVNHYCAQVPINGMVPRCELHDYVLIQNYHETFLKAEHSHLHWWGVTKAPGVLLAWTSLHPPEMLLGRFGNPCSHSAEPLTAPAHPHLSQLREPGLACALLSPTSSHPDCRGCPGWRGPSAPVKPTCHHGQIMGEEPKWGGPLKYRQTKKERLLIVIPFTTQLQMSKLIIQQHFI